MRFIEKTILKLLLEEAKKDGFELVRVACQPATGEPDDEVNGAPVLIEAAIEHMKAWDTFFCLDFGPVPDDPEKGFWVLWIPSNGEDVISDYMATPAAEAIMKRVYGEIES